MKTTHAIAAQPLLRIGALKDRSQVPIKTIRYYEEIGLIQAEKRTSGGFRLFSPGTLGRLGFIKRAQNLGLSLQEIGEILTIHDHGQRPCDAVRDKFQTKLAEIDQRIAQLQVLKQELQSLMAQPLPTPADYAEDTICPIIEQSQPHHPERGN
jgi:MerR family copper efflux transcriptional regulator